MIYIWFSLLGLKRELKLGKLSVLIKSWSFEAKYYISYGLTFLVITINNTASRRSDLEQYIFLGYLFGLIRDFLDRLLKVTEESSLFLHVLSHLSIYSVFH
jgi:hypothetical protein